MDYPDQYDMLGSNVVIRNEPALIRLGLGVFTIVIRLELRSLVGMSFTSVSRRRHR